MAKAGGNGHHRDAGHVRGELGHVDGAAAADAGHRLVGTGPEPLAECHGGAMGAVGDPEDLGRTELELRRHFITLAGADRHRDPALGGDPPVRQQAAQAGDRAGPDLDDQRRGEHPGQERHEPPPSR